MSDQGIRFPFGLPEGAIIVTLTEEQKREREEKKREARREYQRASTRVRHKMPLDVKCDMFQIGHDRFELQIKCQYFDHAEEVFFHINRMQGRIIQGSIADRLMSLSPLDITEVEEIGEGK